MKKDGNRVNMWREYLRNAFEMTKVKWCLLLVLFNQWCFVNTAYANFEDDLKKTDLYKGTVDVLKGVSNVALAVTVLVTITLSIIKGIQWQVADEQEKPMKKKALLQTIMIGIIVASISGLASAILGAYGLSDGTKSGIFG